MVRDERAFMSASKYLCRPGVVRVYQPVLDPSCRGPALSSPAGRPVGWRTILVLQVRAANLYEVLQMPDCFGNWVLVAPGCKVY